MPVCLGIAGETDRSGTVPYHSLPRYHCQAIQAVRYRQDYCRYLWTENIMPIISRNSGLPEIFGGSGRLSQRIVPVALHSLVIQCRGCPVHVGRLDVAVGCPCVAMYCLTA